MATILEIDESIGKTMQDIAAAAAKQDIAAVTALTKRVSEMAEIKRTVLGIDERLKVLRAPETPVSAAPPVAQAIEPVTPSGQRLRQTAVEVSQGMIRQNLLTMTKLKKQGRIRDGEELLIEAQPSGERFRTAFMFDGNKLRERGAIATFYRDAGVREGDFVVMTETAPQRWVLRKAAPGEYKGRLELLKWD